MNRSLNNLVWLLVPLASLALAHPAAGQYAVEVVSYDPGTTPAIEFGTGLPFDVAAAALGEPSRFIDDAQFPTVVSPFSGPYKRDQIVSVGEGGHLALRLSHYVLPQAAGPHLGVFTNTSLIDIDWPNGRAGVPVGAFGVDSAVVEVSQDGVQWESLGSRTFDMPTNGYTDLADPFSTTPGSVPSDFHQPFTATLSDFDGLRYFDADEPDMLDLLAGSGGGTWLDLSATGLAQIGFIRFSVPDAGLGLNFELDAVAIAHAAMGPVVPEASTLTLAGFALASAVALRRPRPHRRQAAG